MEAIRAELEAAKARTAELKERAGAGKRKFVRRGEIQAVENRESEARRIAAEKAQADRMAKATEDRGGAELHEMLIKKPRKDGLGGLGGGGGGSAAAGGGGVDGRAAAAGGTADGGGAGGGCALPVDEVKGRLRSMGQPVTFFGESEVERYERLRRLEEEGANDDDFALAGGHNTRNVFMQQDSRNGKDADGKGDDDNDDDDDDDDDDEAESQRRKKKRPAATPTGGGTGGSGGGGAGSSSGGGGAGGGRGGDGGGMDAESRKDADDHRIVRDYFKGLLRAWELELAARPDHAKRTAQGKIDTKTQKQCKDYIRPLFKLCKRREVPFDILENLVTMIGHCKDGAFVIRT